MSASGRPSEGELPEEYPGDRRPEEHPEGSDPQVAPAVTARDTSAPMVPVLAEEDTPRSWGDEPDDHDAWLREQRPPHWG